MKLTNWLNIIILCFRYVDRSAVKFCTCDTVISTYGLATVQALELAADRCKIITGENAYLLAYGGEEYCVKTRLVT